ncbi:MAG: DNA-directed RNA polymerase subunit beta [Negativicutes bacterium]|nr:DNA-directed RNA polymerase subunit beta [Negativicutes bacterium]
MKLKTTKIGKRIRYSFGKIDEVLSMPDLIEVQKCSYYGFLQSGLMDLFGDFGVIKDFAGNLELSIVGFSLGEAKYTVAECKERDASYAAPLKLVVRLKIREPHEIKETEVYVGDFPLMTETGTFVINGAERVVVSQLVRSPGVYYQCDEDSGGNRLYSVQVIPYRGAWLEFETDANGVIYARVDRTRKLPVTVLLRALGYESREQIEEMFGHHPSIQLTLDRDTTMSRGEALIEIYKRLRPGEPTNVESAEQQFNNLLFDPRRYDLARVGRYKLQKKLGWRRRLRDIRLSEPLVDPETGEIVVDAGVMVDAAVIDKIERSGVFANVSGMIECVGVRRDGTQSKVIAVGDVDYSERVIKSQDIVVAISRLLNIMDGYGETDDIDHLGNRRLRSVGELLQNQFRIGLSRMERVIRERMTQYDSENLTPTALVNTRPLQAQIKEFFGSSQLSQFMDQTNPLAELTHKRRLSALGPGGLSRERAGFEVRDVHNSHYGRMCPIETPEGPNIGLIGSLATFARVNEFGFIETPYRRVDKIGRRITDEVRYMTADEEDELVIAQANASIGKDGWFVDERVPVRHRQKIMLVPPQEVDYMDVSPKQLVSIATAMIPFLEHDDANRALMGANMQRQAVPLLRTQAPLIGTGVEERAARDSGVMVLAANGGQVVRVTANHIDVRLNDGQIDRYRLTKFMRSNQGTSMNQRPLVSVGDKVREGDVLADGPSTDRGELALGYNVMVAFMPWEGYNYEDAILISEELVKKDIFTSIHIEEYECEARDTKLGAEEITRDIPNVGDDVLRDLDERGIIRVGAEVRPGDILVGKVTPKGETDLTAEERLLRAIFGEKAREVRDTSLRVPHGEAGKVVAVKVFSRRDGDELAPGLNEMVRVYIAQKRKISEGDKMAGRHGNKGVVSRILPEEDMPFLPDGTPVQIVINPLGVPSRMNIGQVLEAHLGWAAYNLGLQINRADPQLKKRFRETGLKGGLQAEQPGVFFSSPVFDGASEEEVLTTLRLAGLSEDGKTVLYDGRTGRPFDHPVTVGYMYMLKLAHLVDDKIHARSTGPYSLVTQQPLGGKAQFGGQRFGEMEVWALEAYGAAYTLQELLTVKSDDVSGRVKTYEAIVKGENVPEPGVPESFKVLLKELQSIALDVSVLNEDAREVEIREDEDESGGERIRDIKEMMGDEPPASGVRRPVADGVADYNGDDEVPDELGDDDIWEDMAVDDGGEDVPRVAGHNGIDDYEEELTDDADALRDGGGGYVPAVGETKAGRKKTDNKLAGKSRSPGGTKDPAGKVVSDDADGTDR